MSWPYQFSQTPTCRCQLSKCSSPFLIFYPQLLHAVVRPAHPQIPPLFISSSPSLPTMRLPLLAALSGLLTTSLAHNIQMGAHQRECFHEVLHRDDKMTVTFQVGDREFGGAGNLEIDFWVGAPCRVLWAERRLQEPSNDRRKHSSFLDSPL